MSVRLVSWTSAPSFYNLQFTTNPNEPPAEEPQKPRRFSHTPFWPWSPISSGSLKFYCYWHSNNRSNYYCWCTWQIVQWTWFFSFSKFCCIVTLYPSHHQSRVHFLLNLASIWPMCSWWPQPWSRPISRSSCTAHTNTCTIYTASAHNKTHAAQRTTCTMLDFGAPGCTLHILYTDWFNRD